MQGWNTNPLVVITTKIRGAIQKNIISALEKFHISKPMIRRIHEIYPSYIHTMSHVLNTKQTKTRQQTNTRSPSPPLLVLLRDNHAN